MASTPNHMLSRCPSRCAGRILFSAARVSDYRRSAPNAGAAGTLRTQVGGTYAMEDTDTMAIVATEAWRNGPVPWWSGASKDGREAVKALSWEQVETNSKTFAALNPYDRTRYLGRSSRSRMTTSTRRPGKQRQLYCVAISAKRYALFLKDKTAVPCCSERAARLAVGRTSRLRSFVRGAKPFT